MSLYLKGNVNVNYWDCLSEFVNFKDMDNKRKRDTKHWKWGLIYYNPEDPSLYVDKRFGLGQTFNFAHRAAWYLMFFLLLFPVLIFILLFIFT